MTDPVSLSAADAPQAPAGPVVSIVVVNWNSGPHLARLLDSVQAWPPSAPFEVVVVDNASSDRSAEAAAGRHAVRVVHNPANRGLAAANNQGLRATTGPWVLISNPDVELTRGAVDALVAVMERHERAAFVVPRLQNTDGTPQTSAGDLPRLGEALLGRRLSAVGKRGAGRSAGGTDGTDEDRVGFWWHGWDHGEERAIGRGAEAFYLVRRAAAEEIGLQDERYRLDWEGIEWTARARAAGWEVWLAPDAVVRHVGGVSIAAAGGRWVVETHRGMYRYFSTRVPGPARIPLAGAVALRGLVKLVAHTAHLPLYRWARERATKRAVAVRVSVDVRHVGLPGVGRFATELAAALERRGGEPDVVALRNRHPSGGWLGPAAFAAPEGVAVGARPFGLREQWVLPKLLRRLGIDVHHATHMSVPRRARVPVVLTVHDLFPLTHPDHARSAAARAYYRVVLPAAIRRADATVAVSDYTASEMRRVIGFGPDAVIGHGVDHSAWAWAWAGAGAAAGGGEGGGVAGGAGPYVLYVGTAKVHKNLATLLAAYRIRELPPLVLAGPSPAEVEAVAPGATTTGRVRALGRVADSRMPDLYRNAAVLAIPSRYEGVGLPALEAMSFGLPVVAADSPGLTETVGDAAALVPPTEPEAWADALARMSGGSPLRELLIERGRQRAADRRWDATATAYVAVYESVRAR